jgi:site-specific DNA recombinase
MKIAALYARVSSSKQQQNETIASQLAALQEYAATHDYQVSPPHIFLDDGWSGARLDRPALDRLRDAVAQGEIKTVIILSPDRLARQFAYQYILLEEFERAGCEVVFVRQPFGDSPADRMLREVAGVFAEYECALIQERCRRGRLHAAKSGQFWLKEGPYGYTYVPKTEACPSRLVINESEAEVVRQMFHWLVDEQFSTYQIVKRLNESGQRTRRGNARWASGTVYNILRNAAYAGRYCYNRRIQQPAQRKNMPVDQLRKRGGHSKTLRPPEEWIAVAVPSIIEPELW